MKSIYDFGVADELEWFANEILSHHWVTTTQLELQICWILGNITWEHLAKCKELEALSKYLELRGVKQPRDLPHRMCQSHD